MCNDLTLSFTTYYKTPQSISTANSHAAACSVHIFSFRLFYLFSAEIGAPWNNFQDLFAHTLPPATCAP